MSLNNKLLLGQIHLFIEQAVTVFAKMITNQCSFKFELIKSFDNIQIFEFKIEKQGSFYI